MTKKIIIQAPALAGEAPAQVGLTAGQSATIGVCRCGRCLVDVRIDLDELPPAVGRIVAGSDSWSLSNLSREAPMTVTNMDDWYQYIVVEPGRCNVPVPFELAQIELAASPKAPKVAVFGYEPQYTSRERLLVCQSASRRPLLDRRSTYFSVLSELCRDRLSGTMDASLPTSVEIAAKLRARHRTISPRAVDAHIKYVSEKLRLPKGSDRDALVAVVIRANLLQQPS
ncbi:hypothetical protein SAMN05421505_1478 [Sinosporangium album]|uniref:Uncharacterized protein n=1 Tax=Sinosporangium album TaxID=504805 RepID=A0A1G8K2Y2_9ACTN|nr:hypothetical protein [Sinosporangium album]SDI37792.1 hypothetical protein SAMN05421505_1478 [Sinosporangium album]